MRPSHPVLSLRPPRRGRHRRPLLHVVVVGVLGAVALCCAIGSFGAWWTLSVGIYFSSRNGIEFGRGDGWETLVLSCLIVLGLLVEWWRPSRSARLAVASLVCSLAVLVVTYVIEVFAPSRIGTIPNVFSPGWGLDLCLASSLLGSVVAAIWLSTDRRIEGQPAAPSAGAPAASSPAPGAPHGHDGSWMERAFSSTDAPAPSAAVAAPPSPTEPRPAPAGFMALAVLALGLVVAGSWLAWFHLGVGTIDGVFEGRGDGWLTFVLSLLAALVLVVGMARRSRMLEVSGVTVASSLAAAVSAIACWEFAGHSAVTPGDGFFMCLAGSLAATAVGVVGLFVSRMRAAAS